jgi:hypothetical protein
VSQSASVRLEPLVVSPRWLAHLGFLVLMLVLVAVMVVIRRSDLDFEDDLFAAGVLALCFWVFAIGLGGFVRSLRAGHALRLDADGLHVPGLDVVPWASVDSADLRGYGDSDKRFRQLVVHTDAFRDAPASQRYERYLFGPWAGLPGSQRKVVIAVGLLAIDPDALLTATRAFIAAKGMRATMIREAVAAKERGAPGRPSP